MAPPRPASAVVQSHMKTRVLVMQASLAPPGGGNGLTAWMLEALKTDYAVTLLTRCAPRFDEINSFFGTALRADDVELLVSAPPAIVETLPFSLNLLRDFLLMRDCRAVASQFAAVLTGMNESDLGPPGIQYVHYPRFDSERPSVDLRWYHRMGVSLRLYRTLAARLTGFSMQRMRANLPLANSEWTASRFYNLHGVQARVLYPPVVGAFVDVPWEERATSFVCIGRISPEKRVDRTIAILERVRRNGPDLVLHIIGTNDDDAYMMKIRSLVRRHADWIHLHEAIPRSELVRIVSRCRYGIHGMREEHFGMSVAELVRAGCLTFVPEGGGQTEIVDHEPALIYRSTEDAVEKIIKVIEDPAGHDALRQRLAQQAERFSVERFVETVRATVRNFIA
jgi:glycosyltransferase involved in cell wall biosynthesis